MLTEQEILEEMRRCFADESEADNLLALADRAREINWDYGTLILEAYCYFDNSQKRSTAAAKLGLAMQGIEVL